MSKGQIPLNVAQRVAERLALFMAPYCERLEIAGSIRRKKPVVGDIELVAIPKMGVNLFGDRDPNQDYLAAWLESQVSAQKLFKAPTDNSVRGAWGQKYKKFWLKINDEYGEIQVDLFCCDATNWGNILTIRTGSGDFSEALVTRIKHRTPYRQHDGYLVNQDTGEIVPVPDEREYFRLAGAEWVEPEQRTGAERVRATGKITSPPEPGGIVYTTDEAVRRAIRARLEERAGVV